MTGLFSGLKKKFRLADKFKAATTLTAASGAGQSTVGSPDGRRKSTAPSNVSVQRDIHQDPTPQPARALRRLTSPPEAPSSDLATHTTSVIFVGNPGVGKSALLNALGGTFDSGFSRVSGLTRQATTQELELKGRPIRLVDMPGIYDSGRENKEGNFLRNLELLQATLNNGDDYVLFFVISPRRGRIDSSDLALLKLVLDNIESGPTVGLIFTQIRKVNVASVQTPTYTSSLYNLLRGADCKNMNLLDYAEQTLVLCNHVEKIGFSQAEKDEIRNYVLSFQPKRIQVQDLVSGVVAHYFETLRQVLQP
ncbi:hypothetical protein EMPS_09419 [Entomortierella parvispora]|uniref:G domain-containing protein n=1 Tax=Entomortierella parvispora TaxID=205924 RepID=A0A9P3HI90_9FUNG|nr:hypothetical protein EMPS_09419 [Entomortierella parvispora]